ncbi:MAG: DinB family protein [Planctomycetes bacterium]|nr:DinB family protein [Planctomycetota bacterium]
MNVRDAIRSTMDTSSTVLKNYLSDLSDADLMRRPGPGCNHLAWQLGHLIAAECSLLEAIRPGAAAQLPEGFAAQHSKEAKDVDDPAKFLTKQQYLDLYDKARSATLAALEKVSEADLDQPGPERFKTVFPTVGSIFVLIGTHPLMHAGQFVPVRRALGKPIVI